MPYGNAAGDAIASKGRDLCRVTYMRDVQFRFFGALRYRVYVSIRVQGLRLANDHVDEVAVREPICTGSGVTEVGVALLFLTAFTIPHSKESRTSIPCWVNREKSSTHILELSVWVVTL